MSSFKEEKARELSVENASNTNVSSVTPVCFSPLISFCKIKCIYYSISLSLSVRSPLRMIRSYMILFFYKRNMRTIKILI